MEWQPGNKYGNHIEPKYRAISYTWGRWRLQDDKDVDTRAITIHGVPWKVPRIREDHFKAEQFQDIIDRVCKPVKAENAIDMAAALNLLHGLPATEFVWLDVACIDQRWGPLAALEVGRQAGIFRKSDAVAIWLSRCGKNDELDGLQELFTDLICRVSDSFHRDEGPDVTFLARLSAGLKDVFADPWFTSLWTLQEAYLSQDAYVISSQGEPLAIKAVHGWTPGVFTLNLLTNACMQLSHLCKAGLESSDGPDLKHIYYEIHTSIQKCGLALLIRNGNPLSLLSAAHWRETSNPLDRVYGIMQVFRYRLGAASPGTDPARIFTQLELVDQLGAALFQDRTVQSQLHAFTDIVDRSQGWHINTSSAVPDEYIRDNDWKTCDVRCQFSTVTTAGVTFGHFQGKICPFSHLAAVWEAVHDQSEVVWSRKYPYAKDRPSVFRIFPDVTELLDQDTPIQSKNHPDDQEDVARLLSSRFAGKRLYLLIMGRLVAKTCGLIMLHVKVGSVLYWHRIGTCTWWHSGVSHNVRGYQEILEGDSNDWMTVEGLFG